MQSMFDTVETENQLVFAEKLHLGDNRRVIVKRYSIPPGSLDAGSHASDIFCADGHNIAKQTAFVNRCAEMASVESCYFCKIRFLTWFISASTRWQSIYPFSS